MSDVLPLMGDAAPSKPILQDIRLYFALRPTAEATAEIAEVMKTYGPRLPATARPHRAESWHISLLCLWRWGEPDPEKVRMTLAAAASIAAPPIDMMFDSIGSFRGAKHEPGTLVLQMGRGADTVVRLAQLLQQRCRAFGPLLVSKTPHLTLAHAAPMNFESLPRPIRFRATAFDLVLTRGRQRVLDTFPLTADAFATPPEPSPKAMGDLFDNSAHAPGVTVLRAPVRRLPTQKVIAQRVLKSKGA